MKILDFILNNKDYIEDFITRSTYHSNSIEGSTLIKKFISPLVDT